MPSDGGVLGRISYLTFGGKKHYGLCAVIAGIEKLNKNTRAHLLW